MFEKTNTTKGSWARRTLVATTALAALAISAGPALAVPTLTINGVTFPIGIVPGGNQLDSTTLAETLVTQVGQKDIGVGIVNSIGPVGGGTPYYWQNGDNGVELAYTFSYTATGVTAPGTSPTQAGVITFNLGSVSFYTLAANTIVNPLGSVTADVNAVKSGQLWLSAVGAPIDAAGDSLVATIPGGTSLTNFAGGGGVGAYDVTGGPAAGAFDTGTFSNPFDTANGGFSDATFTSDFSTGTSGNFGVSGSATIKANAVPEPNSLALLGVGLFGTGLIARRRRRR